MPKKRVADSARERGLEPAEVARRLAAAGVRLSGDTVDEAAAARALGGSRPVRTEKPAAAAVATAPPPPPGPATQPANAARGAAAAAAKPAARAGGPGSAPA